jgi:hypothetical protein
MELHEVQELANVVLNHRSYISAGGSCDDEAAEPGGLLGVVGVERMILDAAAGGRSGGSAEDGKGTVRGVC